MASGPAITCVLCVMFALCAGSSQNRLARRIAALEETIDGMAERAKQQQHISGRRIASLEKTVEKQQQNISENSRKLHEENDRRQILEQQIRELQVRLKQTDVRTSTPAAPSPSTNPTLPATPRHMSGGFIPLYDNIRLVGGSADNEGRLEVYHNGSWGTVCDDLFTAQAASVVCHMLGYPRSGASRYPKAYFGSGSGLIWLDDVVCSGEEDSIEDCKHSSWGVSDCSKSEDVGVSCGGLLAKLPLRLVGGNSSDEGRLEIQYNNTWGTACNDDWDVRDATVACRQVKDNSAGIPILDRRFGPGSGSIWMDDTACKGNDAELGICPAVKWKNGDCEHPEDAGVLCLNVPVLRFTEAYGVTPGRVVIEADAAVVRAGRERTYLTTVRTDGLLTAGRRHYWETEVTWSPLSGHTNWWLVGEVGVRRDGSDFSRYLGIDNTSWGGGGGVDIRYNFDQNKWRYECRHDGPSRFTSQPVTYNSSEINRLGLLLNPADKTLTIIDVNNNIRWCSFPAVVVESQSLVPGVRFGYSVFQTRFRLPAVSPFRLPDTVADLLLN